MTFPLADSLKRFSPRRFSFDFALGCLLALGAFALYAQTLVPAVLDGDQGEFQFMLPALGIPHPTGFPLYVLLGHIWSWLPVGSLAYRINLLSAFFAALTVGALYLALARQNLHRLAALGGAVTLAVLPQFWQYATVAAVYRLHDFIIVLLFLFLAEWERTRRVAWLWAATLTFGFDLANHLTILFFAPITGIFVILVAGRDLLKQFRGYLVCAGLVALPLILYLYFPLRAAQLGSNQPLLPNWPLQVAQGIVSPFYQNSLAGFWQFVTGSSFFGTVTGNWQWKWDSVVGDWFAILLQTANWLVILAAFVGAVWLARRRWKLAFWLVGITLLFQLLALQYSYEGLAAIGQFSTYFREYFLPSFITLIILAAWGIDGLLRGANAIAARAGIASARVARAAPAVLVIAALGVSGQSLVARRSTALNERSAELQAQWEIVKKYPPEVDAALVSHWGDLTPLWYYQYADGWRRDLLTIHPPNDDLVNAWMATGKPLYLAGPLLDWAAGIAKKYQLTPWGPLVRVTEKAYLPPSPLAHSVDWTFEDSHPALRALGYDVSGDAVRVGDTIDVAIYWQVLDNISIDDYVVYLSLADSSGATPAQSFPPVVNWLPGRKLAAGQRALATYRFTIPWGTKPDTYALRLAVYSIPGARNLNDVEVTRIKVDRALSYPDDVAAQNSVRADFGRQITFLGWDGDIKQVTTGDTPTLQLLWKSTAALPDEMNASLSLENANGARVVSDEAISKNYPPPTWRAGEIVRESRTVTIPADLPDGDYAVVLRVRRASKPAALGVYDGWFPRGDSVTIGQSHVVGRSHSYAIPAIPNPQPANFGNYISLLGYALDSSNLHSGEPLRIKLHWQSLGLMNESYQIFVHVLDAKSRVVAQEDRIPGGGALPTTGWLPREVVTDAYELALPADLLPGRYQIEIGFYNGVTGQRLGVLDSNGRPVADHVILETAIQVSR